MYFIFGMIAGMLCFVCPNEFLWLPVCFTFNKPKFAIPGFIVGLALASYSLPATITDKTFTAKIVEITPAVFHRAKFMLVEPAAKLATGAIIKGKVTNDFYHKSASCSLKCKNLEHNDWYSISQGISAQCQISNCHAYKKQQSVKSYLEQHIPKVLSNGGVIRALLLGQGQLITSNKRQLFKYAGLAHLVAVSGLHIGIIANISGKLFAGVWQLGLRYLWRIPQLYFISIGNCLGALLYAWLSGFGDSSCRAMSMVLVSEICRSFKFKLGREDVLYLAIFLILCLSPLSIYSLGFWLSVLAVWALINSSSNLISAQINILLIMLPIQALYRWPIGWWMPLANFIAIPVFSVVIVPLAFFIWLVDIIFGSSANFFWLIFDKILTWFFLGLNILQEFCGQGFYLPAANNWTIILFALFAFFAIKRNLKLSVAILIALLIEIMQPIALGRFRLHVLDVGQGLAVVIQTNRHTMLIDTGDIFKTKAVVLPTLASLGKQLDQVIVSHGDRDHSGGIYLIHQQYPKAKIFAGEPKRLKLASYACSNQRWSLDGLVFSTYQAHIDNSHNNASCVLHIKGRQRSVLLPGDITTKAENYLINNIPPGALRSDILIAAHHGSISSNSHEFIKAIAPKTILISAGRYEQYKHPAIPHIQYWRKLNIAIMNTHDVGDISL